MCVADDLGLTATTLDIPQIGEVHKVSFTVWGVPAASEHDAMRGAVCGAQGEIPPVCRNEFGLRRPAGIPVKPFLSNPTSCGLFEATMEANSWEEPGAAMTRANGRTTASEVAADRGMQPPPVRTVDRSAAPRRAPRNPRPAWRFAPSCPQAWENPLLTDLDARTSKGAKVTLPEGMTANPGLAEGLGACTPAAVRAETSSSLPGEGCPPEAKIGSIMIETPLLARNGPGRDLYRHAV